MNLELLHMQKLYVWKSICNSVFNMKL